MQIVNVSDLGDMGYEALIELALIAESCYLSIKLTNLRYRIEDLKTSHDWSSSVIFILTNQIVTFI